MPGLHRRDLLTSGRTALAAFVTALAGPSPAYSAPRNGAAIFGAVVPATPTVKPTGLEGRFSNRLDATFGALRPDATVHNKTELDTIAYYRYIYNNGTLDGLYDNYWSRHRDYPNGDPRSLHVFGPDRLILKGHCGLDGATGCGDGNIASGIMRFAMPLLPGSYIEMRCIMPKGRYSWPAFWLNPGTQQPLRDGSFDFAGINWPPEIDIFDQYGYNNTDPGHYLMSNGWITNGNDAAYGHPHNIWWDPNWGQKWQYTPPFDLTADWHVYGLKWSRDNVLDYLLDGRVYLKKYYEWNTTPPGTPAHLIVSLQIGPKSLDLSGLTDQGGIPNGWDWPIDYVRVWSLAT